MMNPADVTVLVVDDEPSNVTSIEKIFQRDGHARAHGAEARARPSTCSGSTGSTSC
jgi:CheY-like chemotaxis protein